MSFSGSFTEQGQASSLLLVKPKDKFTLALSVAAEEVFIGEVLLQKSVNGGQSFDTVQSYVGTVAAPLEDTVADTVEFENDTDKEAHYRVLCNDFDTGEPSDAIEYAIAEVESYLDFVEFKNGSIVSKNGKVLARFKESTMEVAVAFSSIGAISIPAGSIANAQVSASAAIAGTKISPNFGAQNIVTSGTLQAGVATLTGIVGKTAGTGAAAGHVGEDFSVNGTAANFTQTATPENVCSQVLEPGNYLIIGHGLCRINGATMTDAVTFALSTTSASIAGTTLGLDRIQVDLTGGTSNFFMEGSVSRILKVSVQTTIYLVAQTAYSAGDPQRAGSMRIVRIS